MDSAALPEDAPVPRRRLRCSRLCCEFRLRGCDGDHCKVAGCPVHACRDRLHNDLFVAEAAAAYFLFARVAELTGHSCRVAGCQAPLVRPPAWGRDLRAEQITEEDNPLVALRGQLHCAAHGDDPAGYLCGGSAAGP